MSAFEIEESIVIQFRINLIYILLLPFRYITPVWCILVPSKNTCAEKGLHMYSAAKNSLGVIF